MKELKRTNLSGAPRHYHIIYLNDEDGIGVTAEAAGHQHQVIYDPPRPYRAPQPAIPPQIDPMTGMPMINPETGMPDEGTPEDPGDPGKEEGEWIIAPGPDGHSHQIKDYVVKSAKKKEQDEDIISDCLALWKAGLEVTKDSVKKGKEAKKFYRGEQWDETAKRNLEALDRATLTINEIGKNIDELCGYQIEERTDFKFLPQEGGDQKDADIVNVIVKYVLDKCFFAREESKVFKDVVTPGMGVFNVYMDFNEDIQGDLKVERFPWDMITYGPHEKEDLADCEYEIRSRMYSQAKLKQLYPGKADKIERSFRNYTAPEGTANVDRVVGGGKDTDYRFAEKLPMTVDGTLPLVDVAKKEFRLCQATRKFYEQTTVVINAEQDFFFTAFGWEEKDLLSVKTIPGFETITQIKTRMRITKWCGNVVLSDENPADLPVQDFFTVPVYCYRDENCFWGKVEVAKDPQKEVNKRRSLTIDILNKMSSYLRYIDDDVFEPKDYQSFKEYSTQPGYIAKVRDLNKIPVREEGIKFPTELVQMMQLDQDNLSRLMNIQVAPGGANESGSLFLEKKKSRLIGNQFIFDNFNFARQKLAKLILPLIQRYYDVDRLERILNSANSKQPITLGGVAFDQYSREEIRRMLENLDLLKFDLIVSESAFSPSSKLQLSEMIREMIAGGADIPPELAWLFQDLPQNVKDVLTERVQGQQELQQKSQTDSENSEVVKTLLAQGDYTVTPERAQELGLIPKTQNNMLPGSPDLGDAPSNQADGYAQNLVSAIAG